MLELLNRSLREAGGLIPWVSGAVGEPAAYAETDVIVAHDGLISAIHLLFDQLPA
jgi:hypothetical protein